MYRYSPIIYIFIRYYLLILFTQIRAEVCDLDSKSGDILGFVSVTNCELETFDIIIPNTKVLGMSYNNLKQIPKVLKEYPKLVELDFYKNAITSCPDSIVLPELNTLGLSYNPIEIFSISGTSLPKLKTLYLDRTSLKVFPESLETFSTLTFLSIGKNELKRESIMHAKFPPALEYLSLDRTGLTEIPSDIYNLKNLTYLDLEDNKLDPILLSPEQFEFLNNLTTLSMVAPSSVENCDAPQSLEKVIYEEPNVSGKQILKVCVTEVLTTNSKEPIVPNKDAAEVPAINSTDPIDPNVDSSVFTSENTTTTNIPWLYIILIPIGLLIGRSILAYYKKSRNQVHEKNKSNGMENIEHDQSIERENIESLPPYNILDDKRSERLSEYEAQRNILVEISPAPISKPVEIAPQTQQSSTINKSQELNMSNFPILYTNLQTYRVNTNDLEDIKIIGAGGFATVWLVHYQNNQYLASKRLRTGDLSIFRLNQMDAFTKEIHMVSMLKHANIVQFIGVAWDGNNQHVNLQMLFEYMEGGDLRDCLQRTSEDTTGGPVLPYEWIRTKLQIIRDIASALIYVHSFKPPILHRDLKSRNILLSADTQTAKLSDFGVSRIRAQNVTSMTANVGTARWLAPEVASGSKKYKESADVYAFGMVMCELDSHGIPFANVTNQENEPLHEQAVLVRLAMGLLNPLEAIDTIKNSTRPERIYKLIKQCLARDPMERPSAVDIYQEVDAILREYID